MVGSNSSRTDNLNFDNTEELSFPDMSQTEPHESNYSNNPSPVIVGTPSDGTTHTFSYSYDTMIKEMARLVLCQELSLSFGESPAFERFNQLLNPAFRRVPRKTLKREIMVAFQAGKAKMIQTFADLKSRIALTSNVWTTKWGASYLCVTSHYIDHDYTINKMIIGFKMLEHAYTGDVISTVIMSIIHEYDISEKVFSFTFDNASNITSAIAFLKRQLNPDLDGLLFHHQCVSHVLNLVVHDGLKFASDYLDKARNLMLLIDTSADNRNLYKEVCENSQLPCRRFKFSIQLEWNSMYLMMHSMIKNKVQLNNFVSTHLSYDTEYKISEYEWRTIDQLCEIFEVFFIATNKLSGVYYSTSIFGLDQLVYISDVLSRYRDPTNTNIVLLPMIAEMESKLAKYWNPVPLIYSLSKVFDPRFKEELTIVVLETFYENMGFEGEDHITNFKTSLRLLFGTYEARFGRSSHTSSVPASTSTFSRIREIMRKKQKTIYTNSSSSELSTYLACYFPFNEAELDDENFDTLAWWKGYEDRLPILAMMARDLLSIPISTVASNDAFSAGGRVLSSKRSRLKEDILEAAVCAKDWFLAEDRSQDKNEFSEDSDEEATQDD